MTQATPLEHIRVLVTRPARQATGLANMLIALGARVKCLPAIEIKAVAPSSDDNAAQLNRFEWLKRLSKFDFAIFISPNAVQYGAALILAQGRIPDKLKLATIGRASADQLFQCTGRAPDIYPSDEFNSEALLALPPLQPALLREKNILIVRGLGGREYLAEELRKRGANVEYAEVYQRCLPRIDETQRAEIWGSEAPQMITITSAEGLNNLLQLAEPHYQPLLLKTPLVVVTQKMISIARELGFSNDIIVADKASNQALVDGVLQWSKKQRLKQQNAS